MTPTNKEIADIFENVADLMEIKGENIHRILSYRRASETIRELPRLLKAISDEGGLIELSGIGKTIASKIDEILETGQLEFYEKLKQEIPESLLEIKRLNGVGPKKAKLFWEALQIADLESLKEAAENGKLRELAGMGAKSEIKILESIASLAKQTGRTPLGEALPFAEIILNRLLELPRVERGIIAGSIRRARPTIGDVDLLIASDDPAPIMDFFINMQEVGRVLGHGPTKSSIELHNGLQIDLRVLEISRWGTAINYFTGSQAHNVRLRQIALDKGYSLNEHALRKVNSEGKPTEDQKDHLLFDNEIALYEKLGMDYIPPELREDTGEIEAAIAHNLPDLIKLSDVHADLHMHTTWSDGTLSIEEMALEAINRGRRFICITDHSRSLGIANGLSIERLLEQNQAVKKVNEKLGDRIQILHGTEMDIKADGTMDFPDEILAQLDFVIASLHVSLRQHEEQITERLLNAIHNPHVDMIGHPRAQQIPHRPPVDANMDQVFQAAQESGVILEINANPIRLDLDAQQARRAKDMGILLAINTDAHTAHHMDLMKYGVMTARRAWVEKDDVVNTWTYERFSAWLKKRNGN